MLRLCPPVSGHRNATSSPQQTRKRGGRGQTPPPRASKAAHRQSQWFEPRNSSTPFTAHPTVARRRRSLLPSAAANATKSPPRHEVSPHVATVAVPAPRQRTTPTTPQGERDNTTLAGTTHATRARAHLCRDTETPRPRRNRRGTETERSADYPTRPTTQIRTTHQTEYCLIKTDDQIMTTNATDATLVRRHRRRHTPPRVPHAAAVPPPRGGSRTRLQVVVGPRPSASQSSGL